MASRDHDGQLANIVQIARYASYLGETQSRQLVTQVRRVIKRLSPHLYFCISVPRGCYLMVTAVRFVLQSVKMQWTQVQNIVRMTYH